MEEPLQLIAVGELFLGRVAVRGATALPAALAQLWLAFALAVVLVSMVVCVSLVHRVLARDRIQTLV